MNGPASPGGERSPPNLTPTAHTASPLNISAWTRLLATHPDQTYKEFILQGVSVGFHIGFQEPPSGSTSRPRRNLQSAYLNPVPVSEYIAAEARADRLRGPFPTGDSRIPEQVRISPFGLIPKRQQPGKWRLIVKLSSPKGSSINDGISSEHCSLKYAGLDEAVAMCQRLGTGCLLAKLDLKQAYRVVPVHPSDWHLLGMQWQGQVYLDTALPFGLRSAPKIFSALADGLLWAMANGHKRRSTLSGRLSVWGKKTYG